MPVGFPSPASFLEQPLRVLDLAPLASYFILTLQRTPETLKTQPCARKSAIKTAQLPQQLPAKLKEEQLEQAQASYLDCLSLHRK